MIYCRQDGETLIVAAADTLMELEAFHGVAAATENRRWFERETYPDMIQMMTDERFAGLTKPPYIFEFDSPIQRDEFKRRYGLEVVKPNRLKFLNNEMLAAIKEDHYATRTEEQDRRTISEIYDLEENDRWDDRSDEQKQEDDKTRRAYEEAKKKGLLSGDSFAPPKGETVQINDVRLTKDQDGNIIDIDVLANKGLHDGSEGDRAEHERRKVQEGLRPDADGDIDQPAPPSVPAPVDLSGMLSQHEPVPDDNGVDMTIDPTGQQPIFYRVDVQGTTTAIVLAALAADPIVNAVQTSRDTGADCWFAFVRHKQARAFFEKAVAAGFTIDPEAGYGVKSTGERLVPKGAGAAVIDTSEEDEEPPRPWNKRADELAAMTEEERTATLKGLKGKHFIVAGSYRGPTEGCIVHITPKSYFANTGEAWPESLDIKHLLPDDLQEIVPGVYRTRSRDWVSLSFELFNKKGFIESMLFQLYLNNLD